jgi:hypothetical protein
VAFAAIVKLADLPPVENWTAGSSAPMSASGTKRILTCPVTGEVAALVRFRSRVNCCVAAATSGTDPTVSEGGSVVPDTLIVNCLDEEAPAASVT